MARKCEAPHCPNPGAMHISIQNKGNKMWVCLAHKREYQKNQK